MDVGAPTQATAEWVEVREDGKLLFEFDQRNGRVRLRRWGQTFVVELLPLCSRPIMENERLRQ